MLDSTRLDQYWTPELRKAGRAAFEVIVPELDRIMHDIYVFLLGIKRSEVTKDQVERGFIKFENILQGKFSDTYFETQRKTSKLLIAKNVDFVQYLLCYAIYHRECALCLAKDTIQDGKIDDLKFAAVHLALQCDSSVSMGCYFAEMEQANTAHTRALVEQNNSKIMSISTSISKFSTQTKMLSINAAIEAARAGEAGAGFAVVASEIKGVAEKVQDAAGEIEGLAAGHSAEV